VVQQSIQPPSPLAGLAILVGIEDTLAHAPTSCFDRVPVPRTACHFPAADSGRKVRALIESLLL
jgi:hypothetical protein